jgi:hypothetical protein
VDLELKTARLSSGTPAVSGVIIPLGRRVVNEEFGGSGLMTSRSYLIGLMGGLLFGILMTQLAYSESIKLKQSGGVYMLPVRINDTVTVPFVLDSGAAEVSIPNDVFSVLRRSDTINQSDFIGTGAYTLADGTTVSSDRYILHKMSVGDHIIADVVANVVSVKGDPLLGQSFLQKLPAWTLDNAQHALILQDNIGEQQVEPKTAAKAPAPPPPQPRVSAPTMPRAVRADSANIPRNIQTEIKSELKFCGGVILLNDKFITYNEKPHYFVIDYGEVVCDGSKRTYCGSAGCITQVFVMRPSGEYEKILDSNVRDLKFVQVSGRPAMSLVLHGSACGLVGADVCQKTVGLGETR